MAIIKSKGEMEVLNSEKQLMKTSCAFYILGIFHCSCPRPSAMNGQVSVPFIALGQFDRIVKEMSWD